MNKVATIISILLALAIGFYLGMRYEFSKIPVVTEYICADTKTLGAQYYDEKVHIGLSDDREYTLKQTVSASGVRYANDKETIVFWNKGDSAFLQEGQLVTYSNCKQL